jgi:dipeptidyl aminopeptidase/acylaminoacyl peptidase
MTKVSKQKSRRLMIIIGIVIIVLVLGYVGISVYIADTLTTSTPNPTDTSTTFVASDNTDVTFSAVDGIELHGWLFKNTTPNANKRVIIDVAGFGQNRTDDNYYGFFLASQLYKQGYSILLYDPRDAGSKPARRDFGQTRGNDVLGAVQFLEHNGYAPKAIGIISSSLGAVETLMVVEKLDNVGPIIIDSGIARMKPLLELRMSKDYHIPSFLFPGILFMVKTFYHQDIANINPVNHVAKVPHRTFLFLVGAKDDYVPPENSSELLKAANPQSKLVTFPLAGHAHTYRSDPNLYIKTVYKFFDQQFNQ